MSAAWILHAVGPVWSDGTRGEPDLLRSCYAGALALCRTHEIGTVAFPAISTGAYRFPLRLATRIDVDTVRDALREGPLPARVVFCCFSEADAAEYRATLGRDPESGLDSRPSKS